MIDLNIAKKARNAVGWIALSSILGLILLSFLPMVTVNNTTPSESVTYNMALMEKNSSQTGNLIKDLQTITIFFWVIVIISLLSFIGIINQLSKKFLSLGQIFLLMGCGAAIFGVLVVIYQFMFIRDVNGLENISLTSIGPLPIKYIYIPLVMGIVSLGCSGVYTWLISTAAIKYFITEKKPKEPKPKKEKTSKKQKKEKKKTTKKEEEQIPAVEAPATIASFKKQDEIEEWLKGEISQIEKTKDEIVKPVDEPEKEEIPLEPGSSVEATVEEPSIEKDSVESEKTEEKPTAAPFSKKEPLITKEEEPKSSGEVPTSLSFEKALSSAIEKRQPTKEKQDTTKEEEETPKEEVVPKEKIVLGKLTVRCPQCKNVFKVKKEGKTTAIKCPHCGKEGVAK